MSTPPISPKLIPNASHRAELLFRVCSGHSGSLRFRIATLSGWFARIFRSPLEPMLIRWFFRLAFLLAAELVEQDLGFDGQGVCAVYVAGCQGRAGLLEEFPDLRGGL